MAIKIHKICISDLYPNKECNNYEVIELSEQYYKGGL